MMNTRFLSKTLRVLTSLCALAFFALAATTVSAQTWPPAYSANCTQNSGYAVFSTSLGNVTVQCLGMYTSNDGSDIVATATTTYSDADNPPDNSALNYTQGVVSVYTMAGSGGETFALDNPVGTDTVLPTYHVGDSPKLWRYLYNECDLDFYTGSLTNTSGTSTTPIYWKFQFTGPNGTYAIKIARAYIAYISVTLPANNQTTASVSTPLKTFTPPQQTGPISPAKTWGSLSLVYLTSNDISQNITISGGVSKSLYVKAWCNASISNTGTNNTTEAVQAKARYEIKLYSLTG